MERYIEKCIETTHRFIELGVVRGSVPMRHTKTAPYVYKNVRTEDACTFASGISMSVSSANA